MANNCSHIFFLRKDCASWEEIGQDFGQEMNTTETQTMCSLVVRTLATNVSIFVQEGSIMSRSTTLHRSLQAGLVFIYFYPTISVVKY